MSGLLKIDPATIRAELDRRKYLLIELAEDEKSGVDSVSRSTILQFLKDQKLPEPPQCVSLVLRQFVSSAMSYWAIKKAVGGTPMPDTVSGYVAVLMNTPLFNDADTWKSPERLEEVARLCQEGMGLSDEELRRNRQIVPRVLCTIRFGAAFWIREFTNGLDSWYKQMAAKLNQPPQDVWNFLGQYSKPIPYVAEPLLADFLKNIGFQRMVKVDHHLLRELPGLVSEEFKNEKVSDNRVFILAINTSDKIGMVPFLFDHILYHWGKQRHLLGQQPTIVPRNVLATVSLVSTAKEPNPKPKNILIDERGNENMTPLGYPVADWIYQKFLRMKNTNDLAPKRQKQVRKILKYFGGDQIPLVELDTQDKRISLSLNLFGNDNETNFIIYSIGMAIHKGYLAVSGQYLHLVRPLEN